MRKFTHTLALTVLVGLFAIPVLAADNGFYLGASVGQSAIDVTDTDGADFSGDDMAYKVFAGYRLITFLAVEGSYIDFGTPDGNLGSLEGTAEAKIDGFDLFAVGLLPLGIADVFVKAGMIDWDADLTTQIDGISETFSDDGTDPAYGVGVQFRISSFAVRAEVEYFDIEGAQDVFMYSIGGGFTF